MAFYDSVKRRKPTPTTQLNGKRGTKTKELPISTVAPHNNHHRVSPILLNAEDNVELIAGSPESHRATMIFEQKAAFVERELPALVDDRPF